jgi:hypothetical protein
MACGPVSLTRLAELIRTEPLPYNALVSHEPLPGPTWIEADTVKEILDAIPLDHERLMREYIACGESAQGQERWGWASDRMSSLLAELPELAWELILEMIERAPSDASLSFLVASPLADLLSKDGPAFIDRVEKRATESRNFGRALGMLRRLGMTENVWQRIQESAERRL